MPRPAIQRFSEGGEARGRRRADGFDPSRQRPGVAQHNVRRPRCQKLHTDVEGRAIAHFEAQRACTTADAACAERAECACDNFAGELPVDGRKNASVEFIIGPN